MNFEAATHIVFRFWIPKPIVSCVSRSRSPSDDCNSGRLPGQRRVCVCVLVNSSVAVFPLLHAWTCHVTSKMEWFFLFQKLRASFVVCHICQRHNDEPIWSGGADRKQFEFRFQCNSPQRRSLQRGYAVVLFPETIQGRHERLCLLLAEQRGQCYFAAVTTRDTGVCQSWRFPHCSGNGNTRSYLASRVSTFWCYHRVWFCVAWNFHLVVKFPLCRQNWS